jgi:hypothetical protein
MKSDFNMGATSLRQDINLNRILYKNLYPTSHLKLRVSIMHTKTYRLMVVMERVTVYSC